MTRYPRLALFAADCCAEFFTRRVAIDLVWVTALAYVVTLVAS